MIFEYISIKLSDYITSAVFVLNEFVSNMRIQKSFDVNIDF